MDVLNERFKKFNDLSKESRNDLQNIMTQSPLTRTKLNIEHQISKAVKYRVSILQNVPAFKGMSVESLSSAAQLLEEEYYTKGDKIIQQDDYGDTFYILEEGTVSIRRRFNLKDPNEEEKELAVKDKDFHFGDVSLLTGEPRSATIVVISNTAKCLKMTKNQFDEISSAAKKLLATNRKIICQAVVDKLKFFDGISKKDKARLVDTMIEVNYLIGKFIFILITLTSYLSPFSYLIY